MVCFAGVVLLLVSVFLFLERPCILSSRVCVCCVCDPSIILLSEVISVFSALSEGSQLFAFLVLFLCCIFVVTCSGRSLHVLCILPFEYYVCQLGVLCL